MDSRRNRQFKIVNYRQLLLSVNLRFSIIVNLKLVTIVYNCQFKIVNYPSAPILCLKLGDYYCLMRNREPILMSVDNN